MRLVQMEAAAVGQGYPIGEGIGLFGVGTSIASGSAGAGANGRGLPSSSSKQLLDGEGDSSGGMELNSAASFTKSRGRAGAAGSSGAASSSHASAGAGSSGAADGAAAGGAGAPSQADLVRAKYGAAARGAAEPVSWGRGPRPGGGPAGGGDVDALFAGVESREGRQSHTRLVDQSPPGASSYTLPWQRNRS